MVDSFSPVFQAGEQVEIEGGDDDREGCAVVSSSSSIHVSLAALSIVDTWVPAKGW